MIAVKKKDSIRDASIGAIAIHANARTLGSHVTNTLRDLIVTGKLAAGQPLGQEFLARSFGVSRLPIREGLQQLAAEGLVVLEKHKGASVARLSLKELDETYAIVWSLEHEMALVGVPNLTDEDLALMQQVLDRMRSIKQPTEWYRLSVELHRIILIASGWERALRITDECRRNIQRYIIEEEFFLAHVGDWYKRNETLFRACRKRDAQAAIKALDAMRRLSTSKIREHLKESLGQSE